MLITLKEIIQIIFLIILTCFNIYNAIATGYIQGLKSRGELAFFESPIEFVITFSFNVALLAYVVFEYFHNRNIKNRKMQRFHNAEKIRRQSAINRKRNAKLKRERARQKKKRQDSK